MVAQVATSHGLASFRLLRQLKRGSNWHKQFSVCVRGGRQTLSILRTASCADIDGALITAHFYRASGQSFPFRILASVLAAHWNGKRGSSIERGGATRRNTWVLALTADVQQTPTYYCRSPQAHVLIGIPLMRGLKCATGSLQVLDGDNALPKQIE